MSGVNNLLDMATKARDTKIKKEEAWGPCPKAGHNLVNEMNITATRTPGVSCMFSPCALAAYRMGTELTLGNGPWGRAPWKLLEGGSGRMNRNFPGKKREQRHRNSLWEPSFLLKEDVWDRRRAWAVGGSWVVDSSAKLDSLGFSVCVHVSVCAHVCTYEIHMHTHIYLPAGFVASVCKLSVTGGSIFYSWACYSPDFTTGKRLDGHKTGNGDCFNNLGKRHRRADVSGESLDAKTEK